MIQGAYKMTNEDKLMEVTTKVYSVIFNRDTYFILNTDIGRAKGHILNVEPRSICGIKYKLVGEWSTDKYGRVFEFEESEMVADQLFFFLSRVVKGLGENLATELINRYGHAVEQIIENDPRRLLEVKGIGEKKLQQIVTSWHKYKHLMLLAKFLNDYHITPNLITKIYNRFGDRAIELIKENPYVLTQINGVGFLKSDKIALSMGISPTSPFRIIAATEYILIEEVNNNGHSFLDVDFVNKELKELLGFEVDVLSVISETKRFVVYDNNKIGFNFIYKQEEYIYNWLAGNKETTINKISDTFISDYIIRYENINNIKFSEKQKEAIHNACRYKVFALTGYAGTGKSSVTKVFMNILNTVYRGRIVGCALSGIASRRLKQVSGFQTYTIHSLLAYDGDKFQKNEDNPLDYDVVVVDECGMINTYLFYSIIRALRHDAILIIIGDDAQLPPIGAGNVFSDIIKNGLIKTTRLDKVYRQSSDSVITTFAQHIRNGSIPPLYKMNFLDWVFEDVSPGNYWAISKNSNKDKQILREEINNSILIELEAVVKEYKDSIIDPLYDFQILVPQKKGLLGYEELNNYVQRIFNDPGKMKDEHKIERGGRFFCLNDKIIHIENKNKVCIKDYSRYKEKGIIERENTYEIRIFNGTLGIICDIDMENEVFICRMATDDYVVYDFIEAKDIFDLAYVLTVHKAQGSEFKKVVIPLSLSNYIMLQNQWLYTAVTRAKEQVTIIAEDYAFKIACKNENKKYRNTWINLFAKEMFRRHE